MMMLILKLGLGNVVAVSSPPGDTAGQPIGLLLALTKAS